ncbi:hypothetical protein [Desulfoluna spongiiphila]|uniref:hypothetical protein n=1 Tax=Desulfoluna spongiiphila TaxID=419481 RepID=UPI00125F26CB|nr:hypothetical protein [Desulfoluna spongiiphila]
MALVIDEFDRSVKSLESGASLLPNEYLMYLDPMMIEMIIEIKTKLLTILVGCKLAIAHIVNRNEIDQETLKKIISSAMQNGFEVSIQIFPLITLAENIRKKGVIKNLYS